MDEVFFRGSRKLENLQLQLEVASEQGKAALQYFCRQTESLLARIAKSASSTHILESARQVAQYILEIACKIKQGVILNVANLYGNIIKAFGIGWTRQKIYIGLAGFLLGSLVGFGVGIAVHKRQKIVKYMHAIQCMHYSGIEAVAVVEDAIAPHECDLHEVLINVKAGSLHKIDAQICRGYGCRIRRLMCKYNNFYKHDLPVILGRDCTGVIMDIGKKVSRLEIGNEVWLTVPFWTPGTLSEMVLIDENKVAHKPKTLGYEAACSLPYAGTIALSALNRVNLTANNCENKRILIQDGCTPVGCILIQILNLWKAHITISCFKPAVAVAQALGAHDIICLPVKESEESLVDGDGNAGYLAKILAMKLFEKHKFDIVIVTGGNGLSIEKLQHYCNVNGLVISTLPPFLSTDSFGYSLGFLFAIYMQIKFMIQSLFGGKINYFAEIHASFTSLERLKDLVDNGHLQTVVDRVYHPTDIELALTHIQSPDSIGSTVISFR